MTEKLRGGWIVAGLLLLAAGFLAAFLYPDGRPAAGGPVALAAPSAFSGPVNGGCYQRTAFKCAIHIDAWQPVTVDPNVAIDSIRLGALRDGAGRFWNLYDFSTDISNPPRTSYRPSLVRQDFAIECGKSYQLRVMVSVEGIDTYTEVGRTNRFMCPAAEPVTFLPAVIR